MERGLRTPGRSVAFLAIVLLAAACPAPKREIAPAAASPSEEPAPAKAIGTQARDFLPPTITDEFNPDVAEAERETRSGVRGGRFRIRNPAALAHLNVVTVDGQPEKVVINHLSDELLTHDPATLEVYPELARWWREADLVKTKTGPVREGRIVARDGETLTFVPGAWKASFALNDVVGGMEAEGAIQLDPELGLPPISGSRTVGDYTIRIDQGADPSLPREVIPVAELDSYTVSLGSLTETRPFVKENSAFEFFIRDGVTWHDGAPFTAEDVKFSYDTVLNPHVEAQTLRPYLMDAESCIITANGKAVRFHYRRPYFQAMHMLAGIESNWYLPKHIFRPERFGGDEKAFAESFNKHPFKDQPIYTGPYRFVSWKRGSSLLIERNPDYWRNKLHTDKLIRWNAQQPYFDEIEWILYQDSGAAVKDLQTGKLDADFDVEPTTWAQPDTNSEAFTKIMVRAERLGFLYTYIGWNLENPIFKNPEVRRALAMLIPRRDIGTHVLAGVAFPVTGPFYINGPGNDPTIPMIEYEPDEAIRILAANGWLDRDGDGVREALIDGNTVQLRFSYHIHNAREYHQKIADIIKERVEEAGVDMQIVKTDWSIFSQTVRDKNFDAVRFAWGNTVEPDPFQIWHSSQIENKGDNFISYRNARIDEICIEIRETFDPVKRWTLAREAHRIMAAEQPVCFLDGFAENYFINRRIRGVRLYPSMYPQDFTQWYWEGGQP